MSKISILVIDDEKNIRRSVEMILSGEGHEVITAEDGKHGLELFAKHKPLLVLLDIIMPDRDGISVLKDIKRTEPETAVIIVSGYGTVQNAMEATRHGAFDFIEKPISKEKLLVSIRRALEARDLRQENIELRRKLAGSVEMIGDSAAMQDIRKQIAKVSPTNGRVLILGESGTGKELIARAIHENSQRRQQPFVKVNCAAIPEDLIESELFGSEKGAYTGAVARRDGKFLQAHKGTIFLDEIGDMSLKVQAKVLRVLQEGEFERVGGSETLKVDVRVIAATNKNLEQEVASGRFREDLFFRINVVPIFVPPLRNRKDDIQTLVNYFLQQYCQENGFRQKQLSPEAMEVLLTYDWPGNVRELRNIIERLVIMSAGDTIEPCDLPQHIQSPQAVFTKSLTEGKTLKEVKEEVERAYILWNLEKHDWNISQTAKSLGIERTNLHKKINYYGLKRA